MSKQISLAEAVPLRNIIARRIQELLHERNVAAFVEVEKGEDYEHPVRSVEEITSELNEVRADFRRLDYLMAKANLEHSIMWDGKELSITEAIELAKQMRGEAVALKQFGNAKKVERVNRGMFNQAPLLKIAQFDPEEYRKLGLKLERQANKLSALIERVNHLTLISFDDSRYVGEE